MKNESYSKLSDLLRRKESKSRESHDARKPLKREDWDSSTCPDEQLEACYFYEFARECRPHVIRAARIAHENLTEIAATYGAEHSYSLASSVVDLFKDCPEFPDTPFLRIPTAERYRRIKKLGKVIPPVQVDLAGLIRRYRRRAITGKTFKYGQGDIAAFYFDWRISDEKLIEGFRHRLKTNRPPGAVATVRRGQGSSARQIRKDLKALGAWRLLEKMRWEDAYNHTREILKNKRGQLQPLFSSHALAWGRARKDAEKAIADVCSVLQRLT